VSHEVIVNVFNAEKIGSLVDNFLKMSGVTLKGFEWAPYEVKLKRLRKLIHKKQQLREVFKKQMDSANNLDYNWEES
jgi:hypothetical protein